MTCRPEWAGRFFRADAGGAAASGRGRVNIAELLRGAASAAETCTKVSMWSNPAYIFAAVNYLLNTKKGKSNVVMMPYADSCPKWPTGSTRSGQNHWVRPKAPPAGPSMPGRTPIKAVGATDQHSQLQLYMEGRRTRFWFSWPWTRTGWK